MNRQSRRAVLVCLCLAGAGVAALVGSRAIAEPGKDAIPGQPEMKLPPGWTQEDMNACMTAGMPGKMHEHLAKSVGTWQGKNTMWMAPGTEPTKSESTSTIKSIMDGRFTMCEASGDMPGMGPFKGFGLYGYDNVAKQFQSTWIDNCGTTMMMGTGELSADGKVMTWNYKYTCPITKKPTAMREVETWTGPSSMTLEMFGTDPKSGKEFKMMQIDYTKKS